MHVFGSAGRSVLVPQPSIGYGYQPLPPEVAARLRIAAPDPMPGTLAGPLPGSAKQPQSGRPYSYRCAAHRAFESTEPICPACGHGHFVKPIVPVAAPVRRRLTEAEQQLLEEEAAASMRALTWERDAQRKASLRTGSHIIATASCRGTLDKPRDALGRFAPPNLERSAPHPDEQMTDAQVRATVRRALSHCPRGARSPLARLLGWQGRWALNTARAVSKGIAMLPDATRRRVSRRLHELLRGEWTLIETGNSTRTGRPSHEFVRRIKGARSPRGVVLFNP